MISLFHQGFKGLAESKFAGVAGSVFRAVGIDYRSVPGLIRVHQKLTKNSGSTVTELCKVAVPVSDGSTLWFSSQSGKIWREVAGVWSLLTTFALGTFNVFSADEADKTFTLPAATKPFFSSDGFTMYTLVYDGSTIRQYNLNSPYDISTAVLLYSAIVKPNARDFFIDSTGEHLILCTPDRVFKYSMSVPWGINTLSIDQDVGLVLDTETLAAEGVWAKDDGSSIYVLGDNKVFEYQLATPWTWWDEVEYLLIGGGAGGAGNASGSPGTYKGGIGGGAGEVLSGTLTLVPTTNHEEDAGIYPAVIGPGGAGGTGDSNGASGSQSTFAGLTADPGLGDGTSGNGFTVGSGVANAHAGGGGSTANGSDAIDGSGASDTGGNGGAGTTSSITGSSVAYAGGGGGGGNSGGGTATGGGGAGGLNSAGSNATANTGGGGGGSGNSATGNAYSGGSGGSGVLIVRYITGAMTVAGGSAATDGSHTVRTFTSNADFQLTSYTRSYFVTQVITHTFPNNVGRMRDIFFKADGARLWVVTDEDIVQYDFTTPWDIDTLQPSTARLSPGIPYGTFITPDGAYILVTFANQIARYPLLSSQSKIISAKEHAVTVPAASNYSAAALDQLDLTGTDAFFYMTDDTSFGSDGDCLRIARILNFSTDQKIDTIAAKFNEFTVNGGYDLKVSVVNDNNGEPSGAVLATKTRTITAADISNSFLFFQFDNPITLGASQNYWVIFEVADYGDIGTGEAVRVVAYQDTGANVLKVYTAADGWLSSGFGAATHQPEDADIPLKLFLSDPQDDDAATEEQSVPYIYFSVEKLLYRIPVAELSTFSTSVRRVGAFANGHTEHHPMAIQNLSLFIGDAHNLAEVDNVGTFVQKTPLNLPQTETITALTPYDIDLLIGTKDVLGGNIYRWDTSSESWSAQDDIPDENGVTAFLTDDNYRYVCTGPFARIYYFNGEKLEPFAQVPGDWEPSKKAAIHANSVAFWLNMPLFGLSNLTGNPQLQGVYGLGSFGRGFDKTLSLDFPISAGTFDDITIGALIAKGADLYVAWKTASAAGVDRLDYTAKYPSAYLETRILNDIITPQGIRDGRHVQKTLEAVHVPYADLPANTGIVFSYKKKNEANYTQLDTDKHKTSDDRQAIEVAQSVPKIAALQLKAAFTVSGNNAPAIEDIRYKLISAE